MQIAHKAFEPLIKYMGVNLGGGNIRVAKQGLHHPKVGAIMQKMAGESMPKHVRA